eukprot:1366490-Amphidinium_carterae.1
MVERRWLQVAMRTRGRLARSANVESGKLTNAHAVVTSSFLRLGSGASQQYLGQKQATASRHHDRLVCEVCSRDLIVCRYVSKQGFQWRDSSTQRSKAAANTGLIFDKCCCLSIFRCLDALQLRHPAFRHQGAQVVQLSTRARRYCDGEGCVLEECPLPGRAR